MLFLFCRPTDPVSFAVLPVDQKINLVSPYAHGAKKNLLGLSLSSRRSLSYRNQSIDLQSKSMDWFLCDRDLLHERVNHSTGPFSQVHFLTRLTIMMKNQVYNFRLWVRVLAFRTYNFSSIQLQFQDAVPTYNFSCSSSVPTYNFSSRTYNFSSIQHQFQVSSSKNFSSSYR